MIKGPWTKEELVEVLDKLDKPKMKEQFISQESLRYWLDQERKAQLEGSLRPLPASTSGWQWY